MLPSPLSLANLSVSTQSMCTSFLSSSVYGVQDLDQMLWKRSSKLSSLPSQLQAPRALPNGHPANSYNSENNFRDACGNSVNISGLGLQYDDNPIRLLQARHDRDTLGEPQASLLPGDV